MKKSATLVLIALIVIVAAGRWVCTAEAKPKTLDIGVAIPLTGPAAFIGTQVQNGILMAIEDKNRQGGVTIAGEKYMLTALIRDTKFDAAVGKTIAEELIYDKKVKIILGPFLDDAAGVQSVTEPNKVIGFFVESTMPGMCRPDKPYSFFFTGNIPQRVLATYGYLNECCPEARTISGVTPDVVDVPVWVGATKEFAPQFGLNWLGYVKFPMTITDFMPVISRVLKQNPRIISTLSSGVTGSVGALLIKQLREAGFKGIILQPTAVDSDMLLGVAGKEGTEGLIDIGINPDSPIVAPALREFLYRFKERFKMTPIDIPAEAYNPVKALFEFLDGQDTMDTTVWMEGFASYRWAGLWGESYWVGKPLLGINRVALRCYYVSKWHNGKRETLWKAPLPRKLLIGQD